MSKYKNVKCEYNGLKFDSQKEFRHYLYLKNLEEKGTIKDLKLQVKFPFEIENKKIFTYIADFTYYDEFGYHIVDVKGVQTPVFKLKKKLIEAQYKKEIEIV